MKEDKIIIIKNLVAFYSLKNNFSAQGGVLRPTARLPFCVGHHKKNDWPNTAPYSHIKKENIFITKANMFAKTRYMYTVSSEAWSCGRGSPLVWVSMYVWATLY